ncbi:MAG: hypothetical protein ACOC0S_04520 [Desulfohalobiaceae bacterium]
MAGKLVLDSKEPRIRVVQGQDGIPYQCKTILVPSGKVSELRLDVAGKDLMQDSVQGLTNTQLEYKTKLENVLQQNVQEKAPLKDCFSGLQQLLSNQGQKG